MATLSVPPIIEYGFAGYTLPGQRESGDRHLVRWRSEDFFVGVIDGLGHGDEAAVAAKTAVAILEGSVEESLITLVQECHEALRSTRGVVMSLACIKPSQGMVNWIGIGNVQGVLVRSRSGRTSICEELLLRPGVIGAQMPVLQVTAAPLVRGDTVIFTTDGIRPGFAEELAVIKTPQMLADQILSGYRRGDDDALVVVTRYLESQKS
jgi:negative regulator of sigma-B (phosphoserine phosphatase)